MPPLTRRRSARLASNSKPTGSAAAPNLDSLAEQNEVEDQPASPYVNTPKTPAGSSPAKPSVSEMRPGKANGPKEPPSSALRLGFADIRSSRIDSPTTAKSIKIAASTLPTIMTTNMSEDTPSKRRSPLEAASPFTFRYSRRNGDTPVKDASEYEEAPASIKKTAAIDIGLSEDARRMMEELRGEAQKIRAGLEVEREKERAAEEELGRKFAKPKSRAGRFSAAHSAQFDKMDSIANHPSAYRASKFTPVKSKAPSTAGTPTTAGPTRGLKRTQSKANLDDTPNAKSARTPGPAPTPASAVASTAKKQYNPLFGSSIAGTEFKAPLSVRKGNLLFPPVHEQKQEQPMPAAKRIKQNIGDDASSSRPMSRDGAGSSLPRPAGLAGLTATGTGSASGLTRSHTTASIVTPTKSILSRPTIAKTPTSSLQPHTPSKTPARLPSALKKSVSTNSLHAAAKPTTVEAAKTTTTLQVPVQSARKPEARKIATLAPPSGRAMANSSAVRSTLAVSAAPAVKVFASKTPAPARVANRALPRFPATTPRRKVSKHVSFTPTTEQALMSEKSPSVFRSGIPRSALKSHQQLKPTDMDVDSAGASGAANGSPSIRRRFGATVFYPDLTGHELLVGSEEASDSDAADAGVLSPSTKLAPPPASVPGSFTFRSDKTINFFERPSKGFGSSPGQSSIRQVRSSTSTAPEPKIPGSFPEVAPIIKAFTALVPTVGANKENARPVAVSIPHGITNKKRQRISEAEEEAEQEASERAAKKRKNERVPEGEALLAPRLAGKTMPAARGLGVVRGTPQKASPQKMAAPTPSAAGAKTLASAKKRPMISMSRLNSLARPKLRK